MPILAIETATKQMGVAVIDGERILSSYELLLAEHPHAVELPGAVTRVLAGAGATLKQLDAIVVDIGPGSFTGLRIGLAFAKALAFRGNTPLIGVASLDVLAAGLPFAEGLVAPILDARQHNVYLSRYRLEGGRLNRLIDYQLGRADELVPHLTEPAVFLGDGCALYRERILERCPKAQIAAQEFWLPRAATLAQLGQARFLKGQRDDPSRLVPLYLYPLDCSVRGPDRPTSVLQKAPAGTSRSS